MREGARRSPGVAVVDRIGDLSANLDQARAEGLSVGLVPTMGALHHGHLSLIRRACAECAVVVVTVFVNPLQFGPGEDLVTYPRDIDADIEMVTRAGGHLVFTPSVAEMYPSPDDASATCGTDIGGDTDFEGLSDVLEGASRTGHFAGVAAVVARIFDIAGPCRAYFGEKDWQQVLVVRRLVEARSLPVQVVTCPTVRDIDGLACSSRNVRLSNEERVAARVLSEALAGAAALVSAGEHDPAVIRRHLVDAVTREALVRLDYAAVVRADDLAPLHRLAGEVRLLLAARVGTTRLIDNVGVASTADVPRTTDVPRIADASVPRKRSA